MTETANYGAVPTSGDAAIPADVENFFDKYSRGMRIVVEGAQADTGQTPKETVWTKNKARLYHYAPNAEKKHPVPILMVYALINRPYILDLMPGNSFIEYLVGEGFDVYMLDWGIPGDEDKDLDLRELRPRLPAEGRQEGPQALGLRRVHPARLLHGRHDERHVRLAVPRAPQEPHPHDRPRGVPRGRDGALQPLHEREVHEPRAPRRRLRQHPGRPHRHGQQDAQARHQLRRHLRQHVGAHLRGEADGDLARHEQVGQRRPSLPRRYVQAVDHASSTSRTSWPGAR